MHINRSLIYSSASLIAHNEAFEEENVLSYPHIFLNMFLPSITHLVLKNLSQGKEFGLWGWPFTSIWC